MFRRCAILLGEPNFFLREKIAGVLARHEYVWCVVQVNDPEGLARGASDLHPDIILVDLSMVRDARAVNRLRTSAPSARIIALSDTATGPYVEQAHRLGFDGLREKARIGEEILKEICALAGGGKTPDAKQT